MNINEILVRDNISEEVFKNNLGNGRAKNLKNQVFGKLIAIYPLKERKNGRIVWHCLCECGNEVDISAKNLIGGRTKSCGCLNSQLSSERNKKDLTNKRFGNLVVIENDTGKREYRKIIRRCKCDCGNIIDVRGDKLTTGMVTSCGCIKSKGETLIAKILKENNIYFERQKTFETCKLPSDKFAYFDFYIDNKYIIEFDGIQHFSYRENGNSWNNKENFEKTQFRDNFKNVWCKKNNIPLIRIPYTYLDKIKLEDLLLESSSFII